LIDQVVRIANTVEEDNLEPELSIDLQDPIPNLEVVALKATISKQKKRLVDLGSRLTAVHIKTQRTLASADKELRESRMEELYIQCVTDLAPVFIDVKQTDLAKDRTIQRLTSLGSSKSRSRKNQHLNTRLSGVIPFGQSRNDQPSAPFGKNKDQERTTYAGKREEVTLRLMREKEFADRRKVAPDQQISCEAKETGKWETKRTNGLEPGEIEESGESRMRAWNAIYSVDKSREQ
jgi:hypothetical protein